MIKLEPALLEDAAKITRIKTEAFNKEINTYLGRNGYGYETLCEVEKLYPQIKEWRLSTPVFSVGNQHLYEKFGYIEEKRDEEEVFYCKNIK